MDNPIKHYSDKLEFETDSWDLRTALDNDEKIVVVDARSPQSFLREHIPGAVNIPHRTMTAKSTRILDRTALYVSRTPRPSRPSEIKAESRSLRVRTEGINNFRPNHYSLLTART